ncbi:MAG: hypothetical protein QOE70_5761 [Chthoniobacter sp.]|jgi:hypothetical protein|nr:hypothetical protein [Chthoniobacter sp.]
MTTAKTKHPRCISVSDRAKAKLLAVGVLLLSAVSPAFSVLLIDEEFNYSSGSLNGAATNATGLSGNYSAGGVLSNGSNATFTIQASSLLFAGHFASAGGSLRAANAGGNFGEAAAGAAVSATLAGNPLLYASTIMKLNTAGQYFDDWVVEQRFNTAALNSFSTSSGRNIVSAFGSGGSARKGGVSSDSSEVTQGTGSLNAGTNYLLVTRYAITGGGLNTVDSATLFAFDETAYGNYLTAANNNPSNADALLATHALFSLTDGDDRALSNFGFLQFSIGGGPTGDYDAFRMGTEVSDVVKVVPEPSSVALTLMGIFPFLRRARRKASV